MNQQQIRQLKTEIETNSRNASAPTQRNLSLLLKEAKAAKDDALLGFVYFHFADFHYFMRPDYAKFHRYLKLAIQHLLASDDRKLLGYAYNLVAVDAHNGGAFTIAFQYYLSALTIGRERRQHALCAAISANIGRLLMALGNHALAEEYFDNSLQQVRMGYRISLFDRNLISVLYLSGINYMARDKRREAGSCLTQIMQLLEESEDAAIKAFRLPLLFLHIRILLDHKTGASFEDLLKELVLLLKKEEVVFDYMEDIDALCTALLAHHHPEPVGKILAAVADRVSSCGIVYKECQFYELKLRYDAVAGHVQKVRADLKELHNRAVSRAEELNRYSLHAIGFSAMMADLHLRYQKTEQENELLQLQADTDALTGLPNRYALNDMLEAAFERAKASAAPLCIGILDVDYFKEYNDTYGHQAGDVCLNAIAGSLRKLSAQKGAFCARYGGDEFVIICENADRAKAKEMADFLQEDILACRIFHKGSHISDFVTVSQGYSVSVPGEKDKTWDLLTEADRALYNIKKKRLEKARPSSVQITS